MSTIFTVILVGLLILIVAGLGENGTFSALSNGYTVVSSNTQIKTITSNAASQISNELTTLIKEKST